VRFAVGNTNTREEAFDVDTGAVTADFGHLNPPVASAG
jgi:hypothetical protein